MHKTCDFRKTLIFQKWLFQAFWCDWKGAPASTLLDSAVCGACSGDRGAVARVLWLTAAPLSVMIASSIDLSSAIKTFMRKMTRGFGRCHVHPWRVKRDFDLIQMPMNGGHIEIVILNIFYWNCQMRVLCNSLQIVRVASVPTDCIQSVVRLLWQPSGSACVQAPPGSEHHLAQSWTRCRASPVQGPISQIAAPLTRP